MTILTRLFLLGCCLLLVGLNSAEAQRYGSRKKKEPLFGAGVLLGPSFSQVDGDRFTGYSKVGIYGGAQAIVRFDKRNQLRIGLLYHQKGNRVESSDVPSYRDKDRSMELNYAEVPFVLNHKLTMNEDRGSATVMELGVAYGRLLGINFTELETRIEAPSYASLEEEFTRNEVSVVMGLSYNINRQLGLGFRSTIAVKRYYVNPNFERTEAGPFGPEGFQFFRNYGFALFGTYTL